MTDSVNRTGASGINDRTSGWGPGVDAGLQPTHDAAKESTQHRIERLLKERKVGNPGNTPDTDDRKRGYGDSFDPTAGADGGYGVKDWEGSNQTVGTDFDVEYTGSNVKRELTDPEVASVNRPALAWQYEDDDNGWGVGFDPAGAVEPVDETPDPYTQDERGDVSVEWGEDHIS